MPITSSAEHYRTRLLSRRAVEQIIISSPYLAFTGGGVDDIPNRYSGLDSFLVQPPFVARPGGKISKDGFMNEKDGIHTVKQKTMRIDYYEISGAAEISHDDVKFLFDLDKFPSNVPTNSSSFYERGDRAYRELIQQITRQINDHQFKTIASRAFICTGSTEDSMYDCIEGEVRTLVDYMVRINGGVMQNARLRTCLERE
ncbi:MAG: hypothetical protein LKM43_04370 [Wolbachia endosymbiont of Penenirmus auritus]|nr:hypothetical protein [Wolbachia endosymbiont of Penenirmus auritus]